MMNKAHGSLYDRGAADSYYKRNPSPHYYPNGTGHGEPITALSEAEIQEYMQGYFDNEMAGSHKDYGDEYDD